MKYKLLVLLTLISLAGRAQNLINISPFSFPKPVPANTADWGSMPGLIVIANAAGQANAAMLEESQVAFTIKSGGSKVCGGNLLPSGFAGKSRIFKASEISGMFNGFVLKPGSYQMCVQFFSANYANGQMKPISVERCSSTDFVIEATSNSTTTANTSFTPPQNISPANQKVLSETEAKKPLTFRWTPCLPKPRFQVIYKLKVWQVEQGLNAVQAMKTAQPFIEEEVKDQTQFAYRKGWDGTVKGGSKISFVWDVEVIDPQGNKLATSEPSGFDIGENPPSGARVATSSTLTLIDPVNNKQLSAIDVANPILFSWTNVTLAADENYTLEIKNTGPGGKTFTKFIGKSNSFLVSPADLDLIGCTASNPCGFTWRVLVINSVTMLVIKISNTQSFSSKFEKSTTTETITTETSSSDCATTSTKSYHTGDEIKLSNDFKLKLTETPTGTNDALIGKGTVDVKWIGILNVQFDKIRITCDDKIDTGAVYTVFDAAQEYPTQWAINVLNNTGIPAWTTAKIKSICAATHLKPLIAAGDNISLPASAPLNMPLGYFQHGDEAFGALGFTEMVFKKEKAEFEVIASLNTSGIFKEPSAFYGTDAIAVQGKGIQFTNLGLKKINGEIKLVEPITFTYAATGGGDLKMTFNKDEDGHIGNGIAFRDTSSQYWRYNFDVSVDLPNTWLVPKDEAKTNVDLNFQAQINKWDNFILQATIPACTIPNTNGLGFDESTIVYDHSATENYSDMEFPENYGDQESSEIFSGLYIKNFSMTLPDGLRSYADTTRPITLGAENLIINKDGITGKIFAHNVLSYPLANVGNLAASIDTVNVEFFKKSLTQASMNGKITLPMSSKDDVASSISYNALFVPASASEDTTRKITFTLNPDQDIKSKFLGSGKIQVDESSSIELVVSKKAHEKRKINLDVDINGKLYYPGGTIVSPIAGGKPLDLDLSCKFEHIKMKYENTAAEKFTFSPGNWSFASPQKKLSGFAFNISEVKPIIGPFSLNGQYLFKGGLEFVAKINIGSENSKIGISGDVKIQLLAGIKSSNYYVTGDGDTVGTKIDKGFLANLKPVFLGVRVSDINVDAHTPAVVFKGRLIFYKEDAIYGNGFRGDLSAKFKTPDLSIQVGAIFGNTKYIPGAITGFKYWMVQAQIKLPPSAAIPFMTGLALRGFGGGVYSRMKMTLPSDAAFNPTEAASSVFGGAVFTPDNTVSFGFKAKVMIATYPKEETFNGSVALNAEFNTSGGINTIGMDGLFNCGAKIDEPAKAFANGGVHVSYDFPNKIFSLVTDLIVDLRPKSINIFTPTPIHTVFFIDSKNNKWYFKSGVPTNPMSVSVYNVLAQSYLMFGNDLGSDIPTGFMAATKSGWSNAGLPPWTFTDNATTQNKYKSAKGFAFGAAVNYSKDENTEIASWTAVVCDKVKRYLNINYSIAAGGEVDASLLQYSGCTGFNNGWRAKVSMAMYAGLNVGYDYNLPGGGCSSHQGTLFHIAAGAAATAEFPNPTYFEGNLSGSWSLCGYKSSFNKHFKAGDQCGGSEVVSDPSLKDNIYTQQNTADSFIGKKLIISIVTPSTSTDVGRKTTFSALLNYPYNESFDVQEQQSSGELKVRTFKVVYVASLKQDSIVGGGATTTSLAAGTSALKTTEPVSSSTTTTASSSTISKTISGSTVSATKATTGFSTSAIAVLDTSVPLADAGYDDLSAKRFKLAGSLMSNPALKANTSYKLQVDGALQELIGGIWKPVNIKNTTIPIKQTVSYYFKTNSESTVITATSSSSIKAL